MKRWLQILTIVIVVIIVLPLFYLFAWPVAIDPAAWIPPKAPALTGVYEQNNRLASVERLGKGICRGPEDVFIDSEGQIYSGMVDGRIMRFQPDGSNPQVLANTGGVPLGLCFDSIGNLVVADCIKGLLSIDPQGVVTVLSTEQGGRPFKFTNDLDIAADGTIYFSDSSFKFGPGQDITDLMEHRPNGRLLAYDPKTKSTRLLLDKLYFANGVTVSPDQSFVLVAETGTYQVRRYWLTGTRKGETDIFIDNLPGFPDGVASNGKDIFWLALVSPRDPSVDALLSEPYLRKIIMRLPQAMMPAAQNYGFVIGLDVNGRVVHNLQDPSGSYAQITNAVENKGMLYLGSQVEDSIGRLPLPR